MKYLLTVLMLAFASSSAAHDATVGDLFIDHPYMPNPMKTAKSAAGYLVIENRGSEADELLEVRTDFSAAASLHTTIHEDGVAKMRPLSSLPIEPGQTVVLEPNGKHVMFMGLKSNPDEGELVPATLVFRNAGEVQVEFQVDEMGDMDHAKHSDN